LGGNNVAIIIGHIGSDAGYTIIYPDGTVYHSPGWAEGQLEDFRAAVHVIRSASQIKAPGVAAEVLKGARAFVERELTAHVKSEPGDRVVLLVGGQ
jgi:hypothetical protein